MTRVFIFRSSALFVALGLAWGAQTFAFSEPSSTPPSGDGYAPLNTGAAVQDKSDTANNTAWITADGLGSRYGALLATLSGNVGIGTTDPKTKLDVRGSVRIGTSNSSCVSTNAGSLRFDSGTQCLQLCSNSAWTNLACGGALAEFYIRITPPYSAQQFGHVESITMLSGGYDAGGGGSAFATSDADLQSFVWDYWKVRQILPDGTYLTTTSSSDWQAAHTKSYARGNSTTASFLITMKEGEGFVPREFRIMPLSNWNGSDGFWGGIASFNFYGGTTSSGPWTLLAQQVNNGGYNGNDYAYAISTSVSYRYFKFDIVATNGGLNWGLGGLAIDD